MVRTTAPERAEDMRRRHRESGQTVTAFAEAEGQSRGHTTRKLKIGAGLTPVAQEWTKDQSWAGVRVLETLAGLSPREQFWQVLRLGAFAPATVGEALAMLGKREPVYGRARREKVLEPAWEAALRGTLTPPGYRRRVKPGKIVAVVAALVEDPSLTMADLMRKRHSRGAVLRAWAWLVAEGLDRRLAMHAPPDLVAWLRASLAEQFPELDPDRLDDEATLRRLVHEAGASRERLERAVRLVAEARGDQYRYNDPIFTMARHLCGLKPLRRGPHRAAWHYGRFIPKDIGDIALPHHPGGGRKVPLRRVRWVDFAAS